jgi:hypothetical protein
MVMRHGEKGGRPCKEGVERYANGRIKRTKDCQAKFVYDDTIASTLARRILDENINRPSDQRSHNELWRLHIHRKITSEQY